MLSQKDIAASLAEDLLKQFAQEGELDLEQPQPVVAPTTTLPTQSAEPTTTISHNPPSNIRIAMDPTPTLAIGGPMGRPSAPRNRNALKGIIFHEVVYIIKTNQWV